MTAWFAISWIAGAAMLLDGVRRSQGAWVHADRNRPWWMGLAIVGGLIGAGVVVGAIYLLGVVPRFGADGEPDERFTR